MSPFHSHAQSSKGAFFKGAVRTFTLFQMNSIQWKCEQLFTKTEANECAQVKQRISFAIQANNNNNKTSGSQNGGKK